MQTVVKMFLPLQDQMIKKHHLYQYVATHTHNKTERYTLLESK
jgi:hypothetical protein